MKKPLDVRPLVIIPPEDLSIRPVVHRATGEEITVRNTDPHAPIFCPEDCPECMESGV